MIDVGLLACKASHITKLRSIHLRYDDGDAFFVY